MERTEHFIKSELLLRNLINLTEETNRRVTLDGDEAEFFLENTNIFVKSYMVLMCAYLESYAKSVVKFYIVSVNSYLIERKLPKNLLRWSILKDKYKHSVDGINDDFMLSISDDDVDKNLSANPYKTVPFFYRLGINLEDIEEYLQLKEQVETLVNKRNEIVHHNDDASDLTFIDVKDRALLLIRYMTIIDDAVLNNVRKFL
jgi:hypothetical protein